MKYVVSASLYVALLFLQACKGGKSDAPPATVPVANITGYIVKPLSLSNTIEVSGTIIPTDETELHPEISGRITYINIPEGKVVPAGTLLVKIYDADLQAQLQKLKVQLKLNQETQDRQQKLLNINGISRQDFDLSALQVSNSNADIQITSAQLTKTEIRAPFTGVIGLRKISVGAMVSPTTAIATIRATGDLKLDFSVPEKYSSEVEVGDIVNFTAGGNDSMLHAKVIANEKQVSADTRNMNVRALITREKNPPTPGSYALVHLKLGENNKALMIPTESVIPAARDKSVIVCRDGKAVFQKIKTGARNSDKIEVTDGLKEGDTIATTGILFLKPDAPLKFNSIKN